jgi:hypothetical protein
MEDDNLTQESRNGLDSPLGKLCDPFKTDLDADTGAMVRKLCTELGTTPASLQRDMLCQLVRGETYTDICHAAAKVKRDRIFSLGRHGSGLGSSS